MNTDEVKAQLSTKALHVMGHWKFNPKGWEPPAPFNPIVNELVEKGLLRRADGRCGFERMKDAFVVPTELGIAVHNSMVQEIDL